MSHMFEGCSKLPSLDVSGWDTSKVTNMYQMFYGCSKLPSLDVSGWDTSKVTDMSHMFSYCSSLASLDLSLFNDSSLKKKLWFVCRVCRPRADFGRRTFCFERCHGYSVIDWGLDGEMGE